MLPSACQPAGSQEAQQHLRLHCPTNLVERPGQGDALLLPATQVDALLANLGISTTREHLQVSSQAARLQQGHKGLA